VKRRGKKREKKRERERKKETENAAVVTVGELNLLFL